MSTRCQVQIKANGLEWQADTVSLYHHCDGYPSNMLPLILKAYQNIFKPDSRFEGTSLGKESVNGWQAGRPGKAASWLCSVDASGFETESGVQLHCDIEYLYVITCDSTTKKIRWIVDVRVPVGNDFWDAPSVDKTKSIAYGPIQKLARRAESIKNYE